MKKILVLTDFSLSAENAARYAMHLAKEMSANIKLCNAVMLPAEIPLTAYSASLIDTMEHESVEELKRAAQRMTALDQLVAATDTQHPLVEHETRIGSVVDMVANFVNDNDVSLVVMGISGSGILGEFLLGSNSRAMVEAATLPVLLVPVNAKFRNLNKIAFATDLSRQDIAVIHVLAGFARVLNMEILIVHIGDRAPESQTGGKKRIETFLNEITNKVNYHKIYYQHVLDDTVDDGLQWLGQYGQIQMLAMVHRKQSVLHRLFKGSHTHRIRRHIEIPLLVFPPDCGSKVL